MTVGLCRAALLTIGLSLPGCSDSASGAATGGATPSAPSAGPVDAGPGVVDDATMPGVVDDAEASPSRGVLPIVTSVSEPGSYEVETVGSTGPGGSYTMFTPKKLGDRGEKHPVFVFGPGALASPPIYSTLLQHVASHGIVVLCFGATPDGPELTDALDWLIAEDARGESTLFGKLDVSRAAVGGHSAGSLASFRVATDPRWVTSVHLQGGTFDPHTDVENLRRPAAFFCGEQDIAKPNCDIDFENTRVATAYGIATGLDHLASTTLAPLEQQMRFASATVGWLRWQLAGDTMWQSMFTGPNCTLCSASEWMYQSKGLK